MLNFCREAEIHVALGPSAARAMSEESQALFFLAWLHKGTL